MLQKINSKPSKKLLNLNRQLSRQQTTDSCSPYWIRKEHLQEVHARPVLLLNASPASHRRLLVASRRSSLEQPTWSLTCSGSLPMNAPAKGESKHVSYLYASCSGTVRGQVTMAYYSAQRTRKVCTG